MFDRADLICMPVVPTLVVVDDDELEARRDRRVR